MNFQWGAKLKPAVFFKVILMVVTLVFVIAIMRGMTPEKMENVFAALGIEPGTAHSPGLQPGGRPLTEGEERFNICRTRIHSITWPSGRRVEEFKEGLKLRWVAVDPRPREIGYLEVEKWLSAHCQVIIRPIKEAPETSGQPSEIVIRFVDNSTATIRNLGGALYDVKDFGEERLVESLDLKEALLELQRIAQFDPVSGE